MTGRMSLAACRGDAVGRLTRNIEIIATTIVRRPAASSSPRVQTDRA